MNKEQIQKIRNFSIISHIDHGKSTLADRLLELTGTIEKRKMRAQFLDMMDLEREKGITIKLQPVRMEYRAYSKVDLSDASFTQGSFSQIRPYLRQGRDSQGQLYILNLIDTPGHVDFSYEVSRSLAAVEGAVLLVDASQGVQAQTLANLHLAQEQNLVIIPVVNKIDLFDQQRAGTEDQAQIDKIIQEMSQLLNVSAEEIIKISAKQGVNVEKILEAIIKMVPPPTGNPENHLRALIFDSSYDPYKGVIAYVRLIDGRVKQGDRIVMTASNKEAEVIEIGFFRPESIKTNQLTAGEIGYLATGLKDVSYCRVGDTITLSKARSEINPLAGYREPKSVVFASFYPAESDDYNLLKDSLAKLRLNDASLIYEPESSEGLGRGFRCGFLGMLHLEIVSERLKREYGLNLITSSPSVSYQLKIKKKEKGREMISSASDLPEMDKIEEIKEPWVNLEIITPQNYLGQVMKLLKDLRGQYQDTQYLTVERVLIKYQAPLSEIIVDFYDRLKNISSGYASMNYQLADYRAADLVKLEILVAGQKVEAFSRIIHRQKDYQEARLLVERLKKFIPAHLFAVPAQAMVNGRIIARETIRALKKDVIAGLYGGDYTRKRKLLEKQKKGKKRMKEIGQVKIPPEVFLKVLKK